MDASELGILQMGVAQVRKPRTEEVIGYVYASPDKGGVRPFGEGAQYQRWWLFTGTDNEFEIAPAPADWAGLSLADWQSRVKGKWQPGHRYIWARARIYLYGGVYNGFEWTSLPPESRFPLPQYPDVDTSGFQIDVTGGRVLAVQQETVQGIAAAFPDSAEKVVSNEYWFTGPSFKPAGLATSVTMTPETRTVASLGELLRLAAPLWTRGSAASVVSCATYTGAECYSTL